MMPPDPDWTASYVDPDCTCSKFSMAVRRGDVAVEAMPMYEANDIVAREHYLHRPRPGGIAFRVLFLGRMAGVFVYAPPMVSGTCCGFAPGQIAELARMWLSAPNPPNLATAAFRKTLPLLVNAWPNVRAVVSWCDRTRFDGAFYRAAGFRFDGKARLRSKEPSARRHGGGRAGRKTQPDRLSDKDRYVLNLNVRARRSQRELELA